MSLCRAGVLLDRATRRVLIVKPGFCLEPVSPMECSHLFAAVEACKVLQGKALAVATRKIIVSIALRANHDKVSFT